MSSTGDRCAGAEENSVLRAAMHFADDSSGGDVQRRKQRRGAVALLVTCAPLGDPGANGSNACAAQGLNLVLLVHAQHQRQQRRVHVQLDDVVHLVHEHRVGGELAGLLVMQLQASFGTPQLGR